MSKSFVAADIAYLSPKNRFSNKESCFAFEKLKLKLSSFKAVLDIFRSNNKGLKILIY